MVTTCLPLVVPVNPSVYIFGWAAATALMGLLPAAYYLGLAEEAENSGPVYPVAGVLIILQWVALCVFTANNLSPNLTEKFGSTTFSMMLLPTWAVCVTLLELVIGVLIVFLTGFVIESLPRRLVRT